MVVWVICHKLVVLMGCGPDRHPPVGVSHRQTTIMKEVLASNKYKLTKYLLVPYSYHLNFVTKNHTKFMNIKDPNDFIIKYVGNTV